MGFIPVIIGMAGNVGTQSLTIIVRGLAMRHIDSKQYWTVLVREVSTGLLLGVTYGLVLGIVARLMGYSETNILAISGTVALAALSAISIAALFGSAIPLLFSRIGVDPAVATGPFLTSTIDVIGVLIYVALAQSIL
jgi:magnesium transporter